MAETQRLNTQILLDAALTSGYKDTFNSAGRLMSDLKRQSTDLRKQLGGLGKEADEVEKIGGAADEIRKSMKLLERQIDETEKATQKFGDARSHFRSASIGAKALKSDIGAIVDKAKMAALAIAGIGTAAAIALSPSEELLEFDQTLGRIAFLSPDVDTSGIDGAREAIRELSNSYGVAVAEIARQHEQLTRNLGFEGAQETIAAAVEFQTTTGVSITDIEEELGTARISLGIDTPAETREFLELLQGAHRVGIKIDNIDLGDLETLQNRVGEDVFGENFQREFLTTIAFRQVDSFQFADYAAAFKEEVERAVLITPEMDTKAILKAQEAVKALAKWGIRAEDGLVGAMRVYQELGEVDRVQFFTELEPVLTAMPAEVIARGSEALPQVEQQVNMILNSEVSMSDAAESVASSWSGAWSRVGVISSNSLGLLQEQFASVFGTSIVDTAQRFFDFLESRQDQIRNFFTGIRDGVTPVISRVWNVIREAYPDVKQFVMDVWAELKKQWEAIAPVAGFFAEKIWAIVKAVGGFLKEHPRLVATVITGVAAWKAYKLAASGVEVVGDFVKGAASLAGGHIHRLNAMIFENMRVQGGLQKTTISTGQKFLAMGRDMLATKFPKLGAIASGAANIGRSALASIPGIGAMGGSLWTATAPILPIVLPIVAGIAAIAAGGYLIYKNWEPIKQFFVDNFDTIRNVMWFVSPPIAFLMTAGQFIMRNWEPIKEFFMTVGETIKLVFQVAFEAVKFVFLQSALAVKKVWGAITDFFKNVWTGVTAVFTNSPLAPIFNWMVGGVKKVVTPLFSFFSNFWENIYAKGKEVITWITDKFKFVNNLLKKAFGWLRKKNEEAVAELKEQAGGEIKAQVDVPNAVAQVNQEIDAVLEAKQPDPAVVDIGQPDPVIVNVAQPDISDQQVDIPQIQVDMPQVDIPQAAASEVKNQIDVAAPVVNVANSNPAVVNLKTPAAEVEQPQMQSSVEVLPKTAPTVSVEIENIALGLLAEMRKQTDILSSLLESRKISKVDTYGQQETAVVEVKQPQIEESGIQQSVHEVKNQIDVPQAIAPDVKNQIEITSPDVSIIKPDPAVVEMQTPEPSILETPQVDIPQITTSELSILETPQVDIPQIATPKQVNHIDVASADVNIAKPDPAVVEMQAPEPSILETAKVDIPQIATPEVVNHIDVASADVNIAKPDPAVVEMQAPEPSILETAKVDIPRIATPEVVNHIDVASADVNIVKPDPAVVEMQTPEPSILEMQPQRDIPQIVTPKQVNHIEVASPKVDIAEPEAAIVNLKTPEPIMQDIPKLETPNVDIFATETPPTPELKNQIDVAPVVTPVSLQMAETASADIQQPIVNLQSPSPAEYLRNMADDPKRTDVWTDELLAETRKQTQVLESLSLASVPETAPVVLETPGLVLDDYGLVLDDYGQPTDTPQGQNITNNEQVTNQTSAPTVEVVNNIQIVQQPDQDPEALAELIASIVMGKVDEAAETFLIT